MSEPVDPEAARMWIEGLGDILGKAKDQEIERLRAALEFYANPHSRTDQDGDPILVPDFYDELSFGDTARAALHPAPIQKEEK